MKTGAPFIVCAALCLTWGVRAGFGAESGTFTGTVTDDMCAGDHAAMGGKDPVKCAAECIKDMGAHYALLVKSDPAKPEYYVLSDQLAAAKFSGKKVTVAGSLDAKKVLQVKSIAPVK